MPWCWSTEVELEDGTTVTLNNKQVAFLAAFSECGNIRQAAAVADIYRTSHYKWIHESDDYVKAFEYAKRDAADLLEQEARRRAVEGVRQYKFTKDGTPILKPGASLDDPDPYYCEHVYSDKLMELLLRANRPEKFRDRVSQEITGAGGGPVEVTQAVRQLALANPALTEQLCQSLEHVQHIPIIGSDGDTGGASVDD